MKIFTVQEANALLPRVRTIVQRIQRAHDKVSRFREDAKKAAEAAEQGGGGVTNGVAYAAALTALTIEIQELESLGVQLKDFERGLVDFPSLRDGRVVLLCWQMGEGDELEWWHDVDAGFAGRTPL
ncbi:MAG TPA: DUF2203 domain-containing protein [Pyrinomonadaceae bacterium]|nr:DUF2203 domain-containing protein [Pyrinomonadaceae bacterium]